MHQHINDTELPSNWMLGAQQAGYSNVDLALDWVVHLDRYGKICQVGAYRMLLMDGHGSHLIIEFFDFCEERNILFFCLTPLSSHFLQPLDVMLFQPFKHYHHQAVEMAARTGCTNLNTV
jgi:hypothetical protein